MLAAKERLEQFMTARFGPAEIRIEQLTSDASTREYFCINWPPPASTAGVTAIACVYPVKNDPQQQNYLDVTNLFLLSGLPVANILEVDHEAAIIVHEDFGDKILRGVLETAGTDE